MFNEPASLSFVFATIGVILLCVGLGVWIVNIRTKKLKEKQ